MSPSVIGSPARGYTPPSSNDEAGLTSSIPFNITTSSSSSLGPHRGTVTGKPPPTSAFHIASQQRLSQDTLLSGSPASPPSSSDDSPSTSTGDNVFLHDDTEMLDYDDFAQALNPNLLSLNDESSPEALFFGQSSFRNPALSSTRFTSTQASPHDTFSPFNAGLPALHPPQSSPEFDPDAESPGLGSDMRGLRINSRYPSPVQGTVRLEDVMLPMEEGLSNLIPSSQSVSGSLFETKPKDEHAEQEFFKAYYHPLNP